MKRRGEAIRNTPGPAQDTGTWSLVDNPPAGDFKMLKRLFGDTEPAILSESANWIITALTNQLTHLQPPQTCCSHCHVKRTLYCLLHTL